MLGRRGEVWRRGTDSIRVGGSLWFQIDEWLSHRPSDMEGFIRPGCIVLTLFLSMPRRAWAEVGMLCWSVGELRWRVIIQLVELVEGGGRGRKCLHGVGEERGEMEGGGVVVEEWEGGGLD